MPLRLILAVFVSAVTASVITACGGTLADAYTVGAMTIRGGAEEPYDKAHPDKPPRKQWSRWEEPGEQAHWCRGGIFYPVSCCKGFVKYEGCEVRECLGANVMVFQDGYIGCSLVDAVGCEWCYRGFESGGGMDG